MKRKIKFNQGIIGGEDKDRVIDILPQLSSHFTQRKTYYEYYFDDGVEVELYLGDIDKLSEEFVIKLNYEDLIILV